jgi:hypothetical protein
VRCLSTHIRRKLKRKSAAEMPSFEPTRQELLLQSPSVRIAESASQFTERSAVLPQRPQTPRLCDIVTIFYCARLIHDQQRNVFSSSWSEGLWNDFVLGNTRMSTKISARLTMTSHCILATGIGGGRSGRRRQRELLKRGLCDLVEYLRNRCQCSWEICVSLPGREC